MQMIIYKFADGTTSAVEVTEDLYAAHLQLAKDERNSNRRETRRHTSLNYFNDLGIDFEDKRVDIFAEIIRRENVERVHKALLSLSDKQRKLVHNVFNEEMTMRAVAREQGVSNSAVSRQKSTIFKRLKKELRGWNI